MTEALLMDVRATCRALSRSRSSLEADVKSGLFPAAAMFGRNRVWPATEIKTIASAVAAGAGPDQLRDLTRQLLKVRAANFEASRRALSGAIAQ